MTGEKRSAAPVEDSDELVRDVQVVILDVEGTTTSISFVKDTLFPYVREFLKKHVDENWDTEEFKDDLEQLKKQAKEDEENKVEGVVSIKDDPSDETKDTLIKNILWQMDNDRKTGALKQLQGHMWKAAHKPIKGHVYDDVPKAFEEWTKHGRKLYIYSSGSVQAQKLLFGNSVHGDLLKFISGHFDTEVGPKQEAESYKNILKKIDVEPSKVLFLTDVVQEAEAAKAAGLLAVLVVREGNAELSSKDKEAFLTVESFDELPFHISHKRQKVDENSSSEEKNASQDGKETDDSKTADEPMDTTETPEKPSDGESVTDSEKKTKVEDSQVRGTNPESVEKLEEKIAKEGDRNSEETTVSAKNGESVEMSNGRSENGNEDHPQKELKATVTDDTSTEEKIDEPIADGKQQNNETEGETEKNPVETGTETTKDAKKSSAGDNEVKVQSVVDVSEPEKDSIEAVKGTAETKSSEVEGADKCESIKITEKNTEVNVEKVEGNAENGSNAEKDEKPIENGKTNVETDIKKLNGTSNGHAIENGNGKTNENGNTVEDVKVTKTVTADGVADSEIATPPVVVAASS
ncbi:hypothetical protein QAD02_004171 [Eretmocerus hayati]|uniref:Uncharacterized protein n=1 Tax=Eretmocerus hayati TaxID=131215 RepID=A0ACC2NNS9_9HYME|nr:hypothetical protein QAD02_004171 [Eretmocerus hayati]